MRVSAVRLLAGLTVAVVSLAGVAGCASTQSASGGSSSSGSSSSGSSSSGSSSSGSSPSGSSSNGPSGGAGTSESPSVVHTAGSGESPSAAAATCPSVQNFAAPNGPAARAVPADIDVAWVLRCRIVYADGKPSRLVAERSTGDPSSLVVALRTPSAQRAKVVCPMYAVVLDYFALVQSNGQILVPLVPINNCGAPQNLVLQALGSLGFTEISSTPIK